MTLLLLLAASCFYCRLAAAALVSATRELVDLLTKGVSTHTESMQKQLAASAGGLGAKAGTAATQGCCR